MIRIRRVDSSDYSLLANVYQKYLYEMTLYYDNEMDSDGNYHYGGFDEYFGDSGSMAFLIYCDDALAGFAMVNKDFYIDEHSDYVLAAFCIFPMFRKRHIGFDAVIRLLDLYRGRWEIKYNNENVGAKALWGKVVGGFSPSVYRYSGTETVLVLSTV